MKPFEELRLNCFFHPMPFQLQTFEFNLVTLSGSLSLTRR
jgi:hypothetical protein